MSWLSGFFSSGNWIAPTLLAGATILSASTAAKANERAAQIAAQGTQAQAAAIDRSTSLARQQFQEVKDQTAPAVSYQQQVMATQPGVLQPWQQNAVEDARRQTLNALSVSGLRGSGQATVAAVRKVEDGVTGGFMRDNQKRSDTAASTLANQYFGAAGNQARVDQTGGIYQAQVAGQGANVAAGQELADAELRGKALGDLGTIVNDTWKSGRRGEYEPKQKTIGQ